MKQRNGTNFKSTCAFQCYFCGKFWTRNTKLATHMKNCLGKPGFVYNFKREIY